MKFDDISLARQYIHEQQGNQSNELNEAAYDQIDTLVRVDPQHALMVIDLILNNTEDQKVIGGIGAGPLEDIINSETGSAYVDEIITHARQNKTWRMAFGCVWCNSAVDSLVKQKVEDSLNNFFPDGRP